MSTVYLDPRPWTPEEDERLLLEGAGWNEAEREKALDYLRRELDRPKGELRRRRRWLAERRHFDEVQRRRAR